MYTIFAGELALRLTANWYTILKALEQFLSEFKMSLFIVAAFPENLSCKYAYLSSQILHFIESVCVSLWMKNRLAKMENW